ncbi:MAG: DUF3841 domain-containing protein [Propionibacteriaceae bacterium]|nr:DUF3841 domain-containing protein [Propionibacteriaceae bacterium]
MLRATPDRALDDELFRQPYEWMQRQAEVRLPTDGGQLLWLWARTRRRELVDATRYAPGQVLLTVRMDASHVLLSDFDDWHSCLNRSPNVPEVPGETSEELTMRMDAIWDDFTGRLGTVGRDDIAAWPADLRADVEKSWEAFFDRDYLAKRPYVQAVVHEIRADDVIRAVRPFNLRPYKNRSRQGRFPRGTASNGSAAGRAE